MAPQTPHQTPGYCPLHQTAAEVPAGQGLGLLDLRVLGSANNAVAQVNKSPQVVTHRS